VLMCASAVSMVSIHPHSRCKLKRPGVPLYAVCCFCKGFRPPLVDVVQGERLKCELVLFAWFPSIPILALANDILGSQCVLMLYACCLHVSCPSLESCKLIHNVPLALMCALLFKRVAVPLHACVMLL